MLLQDLRYALRRLRQSPGFTFVAIITLALGLTVNASIFFMINNWFLRPLPAADPGKLVMITQKIPQSPILLQASYPDFLTFSALPREAAMIFRRWRRLSPESWPIRSLRCR